MSSSGHPDVCGCVGSMMPMDCPNCGGHPRATPGCTTCGAKGFIFYPCQRCVSGTRPSNGAGPPRGGVAG